MQKTAAVLVHLGSVTDTLLVSKQGPPQLPVLWESWVPCTHLPAVTVLCGRPWAPSMAGRIEG